MRHVWLVLACAGLAGAQEAAPDPVASAVGGRVVDAGERQPMAAITVQAWDGMVAERYLGQVSTGPRGRFLLELRSSTLSRREHPFGPVLLVVRGPGVAEVRRLVQAGAREVRIAAPAAVEITGRVLDQEGRPVPGAVVRAMQPYRGPRPLEEVVSASTTTDQEGHFAFRRFAGGASVMAVRDLVASRWRTVQAETPLTIALPAFVPGRGRVLDARTREAVAGATLRDDSNEFGDATFGSTDEQGDFEIALLGGRPQRVFVVAAGYLVEQAEVRREPGAEILLKRSPALEGRVVDSGERPIAGARLSLGWPALVTWSDESGDFRFDTTPRGMLALTCEHPGRLPVRVSVGAGVAGDRPTLRLARGGRIAGTVRRDGRAAMGVRVGALDVAADLRGPAWRPTLGGVLAVAFSDEKGRFILEGVAPDARRLVAWERGRRSEVVRFGGVEEEQLFGPVRLELKSHLPLAGVLESDTDLLLAGVEVRATAPGREDRIARTDETGRFDFGQLPAVPWKLVAAPPDHAELSRHVHAGDEVRLRVRSRLGDARLLVEVEAEEGIPFVIDIRRVEQPGVHRRARGRSWYFQDLPPGTYVVEVTGPGYLDAQARVKLETMSRRTIRPVRGGTLRIAASPGAAVVIQTVRGRPAPLAALDLAGGSQEVRGFGPGTYRFISRAPGELIVVREIEVEREAAPLDLDLKGGKEATLTVRVVNAVGEPLDGAEITLEAEGGFRWRTPARTDAEGRAVLKRLFAGRVEVYAKRGNRTGAGAVKVEPGGAHELEIMVR